MLEENEKEKRKINLIVHHTPESNLAEPRDWKKEDIYNLTILFYKKNLCCSFYYKCNINWANRPILIKVTLLSGEEKISILHRQCTVACKTKIILLMSTRFSLLLT